MTFEQTKLPRFHSTNRCPKCGGMATARHDPIHDRLDRECARCGYCWREKPLDSQEEQLKESK